MTHCSTPLLRNACSNTDGYNGLLFWSDVYRSGNCLFNPSNRVSPHANHTGWCHSSPKHQVFLYWRQNYHGGGRSSAWDYYCDDTVQAVTALTKDLLRAEDRVPMMEEGSSLHPSIQSLYQSHDLEMVKDLSHELLEGPRIQETPKVCLLVRTTKRSPIKVGGGG